MSGVKKETDIEMEFRPISRTGIILNNQDPRIDFIFIILKRGRVIFRYVIKGTLLVLRFPRA